MPHAAGSPKSDQSHLWAPAAGPLSEGSGGDFVPFREEDLEQSVCARFEKQVLLHSFRVAIKTDTATMSYRELNRRANRLARAIQAHCGARQQPVAYLTDDEVTGVVANLAILKSGHFYIPLDPHHPQARIAELVEDSQAALVVTDSKNLKLAKVLCKDGNLLNVDELPGDLSAENLEESVSADALARIVYTSGSTGQPKGVLMNHRSLLLNAMNATNSLYISPLDHIALLAARSSAQGIATTYLALLTGARLCPFPIRQEGLDRLAAWLVREEITVYYSNAAIFGRFLRTLGGEERFPQLRVVRLGGDPVSRRELDLFKKHFVPGCWFVNALSSTESGTFRQYITDHNATLQGSIVPVGYEVFGMQVLLLNEAGQPAKPGEAGEIGIRSRYLARGYWRKEELTRQRFRPDPHGTDARVYLTGDLGQLMADGCLQHLGRKDFQVKIRGNRVEPAEVEMVLRELEAVSQAVVVARKDGRGDSYLAAYVVPAKKEKLQAGELRKALRKKLPDYMVPSAFVMLAELPLSEQGKIDRRALPEPVLDRNYLRPQTPVEQRLVEIWEEALGVHPIGVLDDFFAIGGDSLNAVCLVNYIEETFGKRLPVSTLFDTPNVQEMARAVSGQIKQLTGSPLLTRPSNGLERPLFFLHGQLNGHGFYLPKLARLLGEDVPIYALQPVGAPGPPPETIESAAADYIAILRRVQPHGPYLLGGYCNGGIIAFEMAQQLLAQGETVERLVIIEGVARNMEHRMMHRLVRYVGRLLGLNASQQLDVFLLLRHRGQGFRGASAVDRVAIVWRKAVRVLTGKSAVLRAIARFTLSKHQPVADNGFPENNSSADWGRIVKERESAYHRVLTGYVAHSYLGPITVFQAKERCLPSPGPALGWRRVSKNVDLHLIPGDHDSCLLKAENLEAVAEHLKTCFAQ
jgi:amino acid adenylation domain-containing protein